MAREVFRFAVTVPAGTLAAAPAATSLAMPERLVQKIEVIVPPGPRGLVGFQLGSGGLQIVPVNKGQFIITESEKLTFELTDLPTSGAWQCIAFNTGAYAHTLEFRFYVDLAPDPARLAGWRPISSAALSSGV